MAGVIPLPIRKTLDTPWNFLAYFEKNHPICRPLSHDKIQKRLLDIYENPNFYKEQCEELRIDLIKKFPKNRKYGMEKFLT